MGFRGLPPETIRVRSLRNTHHVASVGGKVSRPEEPVEGKGSVRSCRQLKKALRFCIPFKNKLIFFHIVDHVLFRLKNHTIFYRERKKKMGA